MTVRIAPNMAWMVPILEWFHGAMVGEHGEFVEHRISRGHMKLRRTTGLWLTTHAMDRYVQRWRPFAARREARAALLEQLCTAEPAPDGKWVGDTGAQAWSAGPLRLVVYGKRVVTILPMVL